MSSVVLIISILIIICIIIISVFNFIFSFSIGILVFIKPNWFLNYIDRVDLKKNFFYCFKTTFFGFFILLCFECVCIFIIPILPIFITVILCYCIIKKKYFENLYNISNKKSKKYLHESNDLKINLNNNKKKFLKIFKLDGNAEKKFVVVLENQIYLIEFDDQQKKMNLKTKKNINEFITKSIEVEKKKIKLCKERIKFCEKISNDYFLIKCISEDRKNGHIKSQFFFFNSDLKLIKTYNKNNINNNDRLTIKSKFIKDNIVFIYEKWIDTDFNYHMKLYIKNFDTNNILYSNFGKSNYGYSFCDFTKPDKFPFFSYIATFKDKKKFFTIHQEESDKIIYVKIFEFTKSNKFNEEEIKCVKISKFNVDFDFINNDELYLENPTNQFIFSDIENYCIIHFQDPKVKKKLYFLKFDFYMNVENSIYEIKFDFHVFEENTLISNIFNQQIIMIENYTLFFLESLSVSDKEKKIGKIIDLKNNWKCTNIIDFFNKNSQSISYSSSLIKNKSTPEINRRSDTSTSRNIENNVIVFNHNIVMCVVEINPVYLEITESYEFLDKSIKFFIYNFKGQKRKYKHKLQKKYKPIVNISQNIIDKNLDLKDEDDFLINCQLLNLKVEVKKINDTSFILKKSYPFRVSDNNIILSKYHSSIYLYQFTQNYQDFYVKKIFYGLLENKVNIIMLNNYLFFNQFNQIISIKLGNLKKFKKLMLLIWRSKNYPVDLLKYEIINFIFPFSFFGKKWNELKI